MLIGYSLGHYKTKLNRPAPSLSIKTRQTFEKCMVVGVFRYIYPVELDTFKPLLVPFFPSLRSFGNEVAAAVHRFGCEMPAIAASRPFEAYCRAFIVAKLRPVTEVGTWDEWLAESSYDGKRKKYFSELRHSLSTMSRTTRKVQAFIKAEGYLEPKNARGICSPSDESKVLLGPYVKAVDKATFASTEHFVKGTDPRSWPARLWSLFGSGPVSLTDFSSFEAHQRDVMSRVIVFWFKHMLQNVADVKWALKLIRALVLGRNKIDMPYTRVEIDQRLMSGALWTSSSNGLLNLLIMSYLQARSETPHLDGADLVDGRVFKGLVEGDDGIAAAFEPVPGDVERIGARLKMEHHPNFETAGFCSIYCDATTLENVRDPLKTLRGFFLLPKEYEHARRSKCLGMLRAKALSFKYLYANAPVVGPIADYVLSVTRSVDPRDHFKRLEVHQREWAEKAHTMKVWLQPSAVAVSARAVVERAFGMTPDEQMRIEQQFSCATLGPVSLCLAPFATHVDHCHSADFVRPLGEPLWYPEPSMAAREILTSLPTGHTLLRDPEAGLTVDEAVTVL